MLYRLSPMEGNESRLFCCKAPKPSSIEVAAAAGALFGAATCTQAAKGGHLDVLEWLHLNSCFEGSALALNEAARAGNLNIVKWLVEHGCQEDDNTQTWALQGGPEMLQWLVVDWGISLQASLCSQAAAGGNLLALKWLRRKGCPWNACTCEFAAFHGHLGVLKWARQHGCGIK